MSQKTSRGNVFVGHNKSERRNEEEKFENNKVKNDFKRSIILFDIALDK